MISATHTFPWSLFPTANHHLRDGHGKATFFAPRKARDSASTSTARLVRPQYRYETTPDCAYLEVDLPGVKKHDLKVEVEGHKLFITGKRYKSHHEETGTVSAPQGKPDVIYSLQVAFEYDADLVGTTPVNMSDGSLTLRVPLMERGEKRSIRITS